MKFLIAITLSSSLLAASSLQAKPAKDGKSTFKAARKDAGSPGSAAFENLRKAYRTGKITNKKMWVELNKLNESGSLDKETRSKILLAQSYILFQDKYPILGSIYSAQALALTDDPFSDEMKRGWNVLWNASHNAPIFNILEILADSVKTGDRLPPFFDSNWHYVLASNYKKRSDLQPALASYAKVDLKDKYFANASFETALIELDMGDTEKSITSLKNILHPSTRKMLKAKEPIKREIFNAAKLALARIYYEQKEFDKSFQYYRSVGKDSRFYYDSLFEQAWAFFLAGYPNHALGAAYGAQTPFFKEVFNPELDMLKALTFYWVCDYDASRAALSEFLENHKPAVQSLASFLERQNLTNDTAYMLFENMIAGVSEQSLGIPKNVLETALKQDSMILLRDQFASFLEEQNRLKRKGIFGEKSGTDTASGYIERLITSIKRDLGSQFIVELKAMKMNFDQLYEQSEFLYLELLMSQKDKILGKELHASSKLTNAPASADKVKGWGDQNRSWNQSEKNEYWWDEVGFYVYQIKPECNGLETK